LKTNFINIIFLILLAYLQGDTLNVLPKIDFSKGFKIPSVIPETMPSNHRDALLEYEINAIKQKAKDFIPAPVSKDDIVIMETNRGVMKLKLFSDKAPNHCLNFKKLANSGYYDKTKFHRIIPGFMIQGGDINSRDIDFHNDGHGGPGWTIDAEFNDISHERGILSMARSSDPNSAGSQFFICVDDAKHLDGQYTAFGKVVDKVHIIDHIVNTTTDYQQVIRMSRNSIPKSEDPDNWITLRNPKTKKQIYSKVPQYRKKSDYEYEMKMKINSDKPAIPLIIEKIRVVHKSELEKNNEK